VDIDADMGGSLSVNIGAAAANVPAMTSIASA
jgi:hypothetical protein